MAQTRVIGTRVTTYVFAPASDFVTRILKIGDAIYMSEKEIQLQKQFWDSKWADFDSIYTHKKRAFLVFLDRIFRRDIYQRFIYTMDNSQPIAGRRFLDVGCGPGHYSIALAKKGAKSVVGLDISDNMIQISRARAAEQSLQPTCQFLQTDILKYNGVDRFDVTIGIGLFDYIQDPRPVLSKMRKLTEDKVIISFPRRNTWRAPVRKLRLSIKGCSVYFYTKSSIDSLLQKVGYNHYSIKRIGNLYCVVAYIRKCG